MTKILDSRVDEATKRHQAAIEALEKDPESDEAFREFEESSKALHAAIDACQSKNIDVTDSISGVNISGSERNVFKVLDKLHGFSKKAI